MPAAEWCRPRAEEGNVEGVSGRGSGYNMHSLTGKGSRKTHLLKWW